MKFELVPVKRDKFGRKIADYKPRHFYEKIAEELFEAHEHSAFDSSPDKVLEAYELLHVMTACATRINALKLGERLTDMQADVIAHNKKRGYYDD